MKERKKLKNNRMHGLIPRLTRSWKKRTFCYFLFLLGLFPFFFLWKFVSCQLVSVVVEYLMRWRAESIANRFPFTTRSFDRLWNYLNISGLSMHSKSAGGQWGDEMYRERSLVTSTPVISVITASSKRERSNERSYGGWPKLRSGLETGLWGK